jgi:hypothetical protein
MSVAKSLAGRGNPTCTEQRSFREVVHESNFVEPKGMKFSNVILTLAEHRSYWLSDTKYGGRKSV